MLKFSSVTATPGDYEVVGESKNWKTVPRRDTNYSFTEPLSPNTYYSFQIGHLEKIEYSFEPQVFASQVYFFGQQGIDQRIYPNAL